MKAPSLDGTGKGEFLSMSLLLREGAYPVLRRLPRPLPSTLYITKAALDQLRLSSPSLAQCDDELDQLTAIWVPQI